MKRVKDGMSFRDIEQAFNSNADDDLVRAFNDLDFEDRCLFILYLECGSVTALSKRMRVSAQVLRRRINDIKERVRDRFDLIMDIN